MGYLLSMRTKACKNRAAGITGLTLLALALAGCGEDTAETFSATATVQPGFVSAAYFSARQTDYLLGATAAPPSGSVNDTVAHLARARLDPTYTPPAGAVGPTAWDAVFAKLARLDDTSDFDLLGLLNALYLGRNHPMVAPETWSKTEAAVLGFKYWYTDPTPDGATDNMWYWSENHQIMFHTDEYLAGQLFPERAFAIAGMTGAQHLARARALMLDWMTLRARFGFSEWLSNVYYAEDLSPLLMLAEFAQDEEIARRAAMLLDLLFYDLALQTHRASFGVTHGRTYKKDKMSALDDNTFNTVKLLFDTAEEPYTSYADTALLLAQMQRYRLPQVILDVARHASPFTNQERMGIVFDENEPMVPGVEPQHPYGFSYTDPAALPIWWGMSNLTAWQVLPLSLQVITQYNLWDTVGFAPYSSLRGFADDPVLAQTVALNLAAAISMALLEEVNIHTYRTPDYMLSSAQDYRKGARSNQSHTWQASLGTNALVFTTHPGQPPLETLDWGTDGEPGQWTGTASIPRAAQHENVAIYLYAPQYAANPSPPFNQITAYEPYTHAYFPQDAFDEVARDGHWTFGRYRDGYIALYSWRDPEFVSYDPTVIATNGMVQAFELRAAGGPQNVWIVECGRQVDWGSFVAFRTAVAASTVSVTPITTGDGLPPHTRLPVFDVAYESPSQGRMEFSWTGPLRVRGEEVAISGYPRYQNPWSQSPFDSQRVEIADDTARLTLDFVTAERTAAVVP